VASNGRSKKNRNTAGGNGPVTPYDHLLYLLFEFEQTLERGEVEWTASRMERIQARLAGILERLARASDRDGSA
jgi:hypothetical protein